MRISVPGVLHSLQVILNLCTSSCGYQCQLKIRRERLIVHVVEYPYLEVTFGHATKDRMVAQPLRSHPRTRHSKPDPSQKARIVSSFRRTQYSRDLGLINTVFLLMCPCLRVLNRFPRGTEAAGPAAGAGYRILIAEMTCKLTVQASIYGDKLDHPLDPFHVASFSFFELRIYLLNDGVLGSLILGELLEDFETVYDSTGLEVDSSAVIPFL